MLDFIKSELLRFRPWAIAYAALHLVVLAFLTRVVDLAQQPLFAYQVFAAVYVASGVLLGAYQMGVYRKPNAWLNLLHRPLPHRRLALALMLAAALLLMLGVLLPILVAAGWQEAMTARVLDTRHLWLALSAWLLSVCGYLAGGYAMLANRRYATASFILLVALALFAAQGLAAIAVQVAVLAWLAWMLLASFKPDLAAHPRSGAGVLAVALPLQLTVWFALALLGFGFEIAWIMQGTHPNNLPVPRVGSSKEVDSAEGPQAMILGLQGSRVPEAALWREQAAISDVYTTGAGLDDLPVRNELTNVAPMEFDDELRRVRWVFSHDDMRFHGYGLADPRAVGTLGLEGQGPFPLPPLPLGKDRLVTREAVYAYDEEQGRIVARLRAPAGEQLVGVDRAGERLALVTQRAVYYYDARDLDTIEGLLTPRLRVPIPGRVGRLARIDTLELLDGVLVSFTFTRDDFHGEGAPYQALVRVDEAGRAGEVSRRVLDPGYSPYYLYSSWYLSPALHALKKHAVRLFAGYRPEFDLPARAMPRGVYLLAGLLALASILLAAWRLRRIEATGATRLAWIAACGLVGLPALLALWLLYPARESLEDLELAAPAAA